MVERYPAIIRRNQTWQDIIKTFEFPNTESNIPPSRQADGSTLLRFRSWSHPEVQISLVNEENMEFLLSKEATIDKTFDSISFGIDSTFMMYSDGSFPTPDTSPPQAGLRQVEGQAG